MITEDEIKRINELAQKSKTDEGLSEDEKKEQHKLRRKYIDSFKNNLRLNQMLRIIRNPNVDYHYLIRLYAV